MSTQNKMLAASKKEKHSFIDFEIYQQLLLLEIQCLTFPFIQRHSKQLLDQLIQNNLSGEQIERDLYSVMRILQDLRLTGQPVAAHYGMEAISIDYLRQFLNYVQGLYH